MHKTKNNNNFERIDVKNRAYYLHDLIKIYDLDFENIKLDEKPKISFNSLDMEYHIV